MYRKKFSLGIFLIIMGSIFLLSNLNILSFDWILFIISIGLIISYMYRQNIIYLIGGLILLSISSVALIDTYIFSNIDIKAFIYLLVLGSGLVYIYHKSNIRSFILIGSFILALSANSLLSQLIVVDISWLKFILFALSFYISYLIAYKSNGIIWPKYISYLMLIMGIIYLLSIQDFFDLRFLKITYIIPIIIIIIGIRIVYITIKDKI